MVNHEPMSLHAMLHKDMHNEVPDSVLNHCIDSDKVLVENLLRLAQAELSILNLASTTIYFNHWLGVVTSQNSVTHLSAPLTWTNAADCGAVASAAAVCCGAGGLYSAQASGLHSVAADAAAAADGRDSRQHCRPVLALQRADGPDAELADDARRSALWVRHPAVCGARRQYQVGQPCRRRVARSPRTPGACWH